MDRDTLTELLESTASTVATTVRSELTKAEFSKVVAREVVSSLNSDEVRRFIWLSANSRPRGIHWSYYRPESITDVVYETVAKESSDFIKSHLKGAVETENQLDNLSHAINAVTVSNGLILEFGVFEGVTINHIANTLSDETIHGFDSFDGLPDDWTLGAPAGSYSTQGKLPKVAGNVQLHIGLFENILPDFKKVHTLPISLLHIDSDLYSSANTVLTMLEEQIVPGTIIVFDEFLNYPGFKEHEYRAFFEFIDRTGRSFQLLSYVDRGFSVSIAIT